MGTHVQCFVQGFSSATQDSAGYLSGADLETRVETAVCRQCFCITKVSGGYDPCEPDDSGQFAYLRSCCKDTDHLVSGERSGIGFPLHGTGLIEDLSLAFLSLGCKPVEFFVLITEDETDFQGNPD